MLNVILGISKSPQKLDQNLRKNVVDKQKRGSQSDPRQAVVIAVMLNL